MQRKQKIQIEIVKYRCFEKLKMRLTIVARRLLVNENRTVGDENAVKDGNGVMVQQQCFINALIHSLSLSLSL